MGTSMTAIAKGVRDAPPCAAVYAHDYSDWDTRLYLNAQRYLPQCMNQSLASHVKGLHFYLCQLY